MRHLGTTSSNLRPAAPKKTGKCAAKGEANAIPPDGTNYVWSDKWKWWKTIA